MIIIVVTQENPSITEVPTIKVIQNYNWVGLVVGCGDGRGLKIVMFEC